MESSSSEHGQGLVEYAFLLVFIAVMVIAVLEITGVSLYDLYDFAIGKLVEVFV